MFEEPRYIQNSFNLIFPRQPEIRRKANEFEDSLRGMYFQPQIIPVPDNLDQEVPRMIFGSLHGFSQIVVTQINLVLSVNYSSDWQEDIARGKEYLDERVPLLFELLSLLENVKPSFCGLTTVARIRSDAGEKDIFNHLSKVLLKEQDIPNLHDINLKISEVKEDHFFSNITIQNYRTWSLGTSEAGLPRLSSKDAIEAGIEVIGDFNDRYRYNEDKDYNTGLEIAGHIIEKGIKVVNEKIEILRGAAS